MRTRRDPRVERQARLITGGERRRYGLAPITQPSARPRRDQRALRRAAMIIAGIRPRIDWHAGRTGMAIAAGRVTVAERPASEPEMRVVAEPAFLVLAVPDHPGGVLSDHDREVIGAARQLADAGGGAVVVLTAGEIAGLDVAGADGAMPLPTGQAGEYAPEDRTAAVLAAIDMLKPRHILFPENAQGGADLARRVAALCGERLFSGVETISAGQVSRRIRGGSMAMATTPPALMSITEGAAAPHEGVRHEACKLDAPEFLVTRKIEKAAPLKIEANAISLSDADFILSGGNGVTDWRSFAELGDVLGATLGGSRVVCDEGHLPRDRQVGASGSLVTARCYLAFGIAGAPQHLQGIAEVKRVVAINTDLHAEMIKRADLAIIADAQEVMPALIRHARSSQASGGRGSDGVASSVESPLSHGERVGVRGYGLSVGHDLTSPIARTPSPWSLAPWRVLRNWHGSRLRSPLPRGEGQGEGVCPIDSPPPLTPTLSPWERERPERLERPVFRSQRQDVGFRRTLPLERGPEAASRRGTDRCAVVKIAVLLSVGRHPASGRARRAPLDARALEMALSIPGAEVHAVHAGDPAEPALRDYLGMGLARLSVLAVSRGRDPVPALAAHLKQLAPDVVLCGGRAESGEDSGLVPYLVAEALGFAMVADTVALGIGAGEAGLTQALPRGKRRLVETRKSVVATVSAAAPAPRQSAFARARRGIIEPVAADAPTDTFIAGAEIRPWRPRPKRMRLAVAASAADRLRAMTETRSGEGAVMVNPSPEDAARAIYDYLLEKRIIEEVRP
jgi:electron transfer flavoprotein alpha subunit